MQQLLKLGQGAKLLCVVVAQDGPRQPWAEDEEEVGPREGLEALQPPGVRVVVGRVVPADVDEDAAERESEDEDGENEDTHEEGLGPVVEEDALDDDDDNDIPDYGDDEDDPFLKAIGGADKLLTGEAYQRKLMEQMKEKQ